MDRLDGFRLVGIRMADAATFETGDDPGIEPVREVREVWWTRREDGVVDDATRERRLVEQAGQDGAGIGGGGGGHGGRLPKRTGGWKAAGLADPRPRAGHGA